MIIQCEVCDTRFRLADEKLKTSGTKVRCSKCKHVFTVMPPAPEEAEEGIDFDAMNMEAVSEPTLPPESPAIEEPASDDDDRRQEGLATAAAADVGRDLEPDEMALDFSSLEQEMSAKSVDRGELAEEFSFAIPGPEDEETAEDLAERQSPKFTFEEPTDEPSPAVGEHVEEFDFADPSVPETAPEEFTFGEPDDEAPPDFPDKPASAALNEEFGMADGIEEFTFDDEPEEDEEVVADQWRDEPAFDDTAFDFDEPAFDTEPPGATASTRDDDLQFGEINLKSPSGEQTPHFGGEDDFSGASLSREESRERAPAPKIPRPRQSPPPRMYDDSPLEAPAIKRKSPLSRILFLLTLLLLALGSAAGYFYLEDGSLDINRILQRFTGETPPEVAEHKIGINILGSSYVNNRHAGQLLVVQGEAVNNFPTARSAITVKGLLVDANGKTLFQQTVSCGNPLDKTTVSKVPFSKIEEAMNNQFGDSLSNMNVASGVSIPFTIVFRNLPAGIASINVEVVGSKPGSS
jgi:predicted Zn finger-like uncharacterized protein